MQHSNKTFTAYLSCLADLSVSVAGQLSDFSNGNSTPFITKREAALRITEAIVNDGDASCIGQTVASWSSNAVGSTREQ